MIDETTVEAATELDTPEGGDEHEMEQEADAEARLATLAGRVIELESELLAARETLEASEHDRALERALGSCGAVDTETVRVLVEHEMAADPSLDVEAALGALRDRKPVLFSRCGGAGVSVQAARALGAGDGGLDAARTAAHAGDRASLMRYLRLRRENN